MNAGARVLELCHVELKEANEFVASLHRHHKPVVGHRFSVGCRDGEKLVGVAIVGRPVARAVNQYTTVEVLRLCTDGTKNACTFLYSACARAALNLGYEKIQTYILDSEPGTSLKASGWQAEAKTQGGDWNHSWRKGRRTDQPQCPKVRWAKILRPAWKPVGADSGQHTPSSTGLMEEAINTRQ